MRSTQLILNKKEKHFKNEQKVYRNGAAKKEHVQEEYVDISNMRISI